MKKNKILKIAILCLAFYSLISCDKKKKVEPVITINDSVKVKKIKNETIKKNIVKNEIDPIDALIDSLLKSKIKTVKKENENNFEKGIYLTAYSAARKSFEDILDMAKNAGINTIVFDVKNMDGYVFDYRAKNVASIPFKISRTICIADVAKIIHSRNMEAVSRIVMFHDMNLARQDSTLCPKRADGSHWVESKRKGPAWLDPSNKKTQNMLLKLIDWTAQQGVDEIQMDYVRFPTQGDVQNAIFAFQEEDSLFAKKDSLYKVRKKDDIIADFVRKASLICHSHNVKLAADIFAITAWQRKADILATGQNLRKMTPYLDKIHPMIYSSHFDKHFDFRENYWNEGYLSVFEGTIRTIVNSNKKCKIIPYIQGNGWRVNYNKEYIYSQIAATKDANAKGYIFWNASNRYQKIFNWIQKKPDDRL